MQLFYHPDLYPDRVTFSQEESRHIRVLRLKPGDSLYVTDGKGVLCKALVEDSNASACQVRIMERYPGHGKRTHFLHIAISPTKQMERLEWFLEKATEAGIDEITPVICHHAERRELKTERLHKIIQSAMKQSLKAYLPTLNETTTLANFLQQTGPANKFIAHLGSGGQQLLKDCLVKNSHNLVLIGPEGDFDQDELKMAIESGFQPVSLGSSRLRTETAGVFVSILAEIINS